MIAGPQYAGDVDQWLQYEPADPLHQLVASGHIYEPNWAPCDTQACWTGQLDPLAAHVPVVIGELGSKDCTASSIGPLLDNADANGISYLHGRPARVRHRLADLGLVLPAVPAVGPRRHGGGQR